MNDDEKFAADLLRQCALKAVEQWDGVDDEGLLQLLDLETGSSFQAELNVLRARVAELESALRRRIKELEQDRDFLSGELARLGGENARLREALKPFADSIDLIDGWSRNYWKIPDWDYFYIHGYQVPFAVAHCRRAARLLEGKE